MILIFSLSRLFLGAKKSTTHIGTKGYSVDLNFNIFFYFTRYFRILQNIKVSKYVSHKFLVMYATLKRLLAPHSAQAIYKAAAPYQVRPARLWPYLDFEK